MAAAPADTSDSAGSNEQETAQDRPMPRQPKSDAHAAQVTVQNRRRDYLARHPEYFDSIEHELADPVLYERLIKRHQSATEREAEGRKKGYGRTLEADLVRGETKISDLRASSSIPGDALQKPASTGVDESWDQPAESKQQGLELWREFLTDRFVKGRDEEFDYRAVDASDEFDDLARREAEDVWFEEEEPTRAGEEGDGGELQGETGVQDF